MSEPPTEISFRLRVHRDPVRRKWWQVMPLQIGAADTILLVPNSIATRSVITPAAFRRLRTRGLIGADIFDFPTGQMSCVLRQVSIEAQPAPDLAVRIRDVDELLIAQDEYLVDGYLGLDYLLGAFSSFTIDSQSLRVRLGLYLTPSSSPKTSQS